MAYINFQPYPKIPPIGFFEPISTDPKDMMTDVEFLLGVWKKLNEIIKQVNSNSEWISSYEGKIEEIEAQVASLREEMTAFEGEVRTTMAREFNEIRVELQAMIATALIQANAYTDAVASRLETEIEEISIGQISVFDPTTGIYSPLQIVIDNLYNSSREDALTASEYDGLELTATDYDAYELTATEYDQHAKSLLVSVVSS